MKLWKTTLLLSHDKGNLISNSIDINSGIFQGDSLSPLLFCIALIPLSQQLNNTGYGYKIENKVIDHLFFMDDLKLYAKNDSELEGLLHTVKKFSDDIGMSFGLDKCAKATFARGKMIKAPNVKLDNDNVIRNLDQEETYKYLGVVEGDGIGHSAMKERVRKECYRRVRAILKTELNSANRVEAINTLVIPVVTYSYNVINWNIPEIKRIDTKIRKLLTTHRMHHPKSDVDRLYVPQKEGGRGLIQLELTYKTTTIGLKKYLETNDDWMIQLVRKHEQAKRAHSVTKEANKFNTELNIDCTTNEQLIATKQAKSLKVTAKKESLKKLKENWENKPLHGQYPLRTQAPDVDKNKTHQWLRSAGLKAETEGFIMAAQDQSLYTRNYQAKIIKNGTSPKCRFCDKFDETIDHLISGCHVLAPNEYQNRHDRVGQYLHWKICKHYDLPTDRNWYNHKPKPVVENEKAIILWDFPINTDRTIQANRPDIIVKDYETRKCLMIDMTVPTDRNVSVKEFDKLSKYKDLQIEVERMWRLKTTIVPVVVGALGLIKKDTDKHIIKIPGDPSLQEIQKIVLNSTAHILRKVLSI